MTRFSDDALVKIRRAFDSEQGEALIDFMRCLSLGQSADAHSNDLRELAVSLDWLDATAQRTHVGTLVSDSCREYRFFVERNKNLPWVDAVPQLGPAYFSNKDVVEIGAGMGANLMALASTASSITGVEPTQAYIQLGDLFAQKEHISASTTVIGQAESLPLKDASADVVLCVTAHQYFDIVPAMQEIARILRPGGEVFFFGATLSDIVKQRLRYQRGPKAIAKLGVIIANTMSYTYFGKRAIPARGPWAMGRPVHPTAMTMWRWMDRAGIHPVRESIRVGEDCCVKGQKALVTQPNQ